MGERGRTGQGSAVAEVMASLVQHAFLRIGERAEAVEIDLVEDAIDLGAEGVARAGGRRRRHVRGAGVERGVEIHGVSASGSRG